MTRKSRREAIHDFGKPEHQHVRAVRARARKLRDEENRRRQLAGAVESFCMNARSEYDTLH